eukprot:49709-Hanusia_phi.AAC.1
MQPNIIGFLLSDFSRPGKQSDCFFLHSEFLRHRPCFNFQHSEQAKVIVLSARRASSSHSTQLRLRGNPISDLLSENSPQRAIWQSVMESMNLGKFTQQPISLLSAADKFLHGLPINLP